MPETAPGGTWEATEAIGLGGRSSFPMRTDEFCNDCCMFDNTVVNLGFEVGSLGELNYWTYFHHHYLSLDLKGRGWILHEHGLGTFDLCTC